MEQTRREQEVRDVQMGQELLASVRGSAAEREIEEFLHQYGFVNDRAITDEAKAEADRHQRYVLKDNIRVFLNRYRAQREILTMVKEELIARVATESIGTLGDKESAASPEGFFTSLCRKLDLLSAYDEKAMRNRYESRITACRYIEDAIATLDRSMRVLKAHQPESYAILNVVYIEGTTRPTIKEAIAKLNLSGTSSYYQKLERAEQLLSGLVLSCTLDRRNFVQMMVYLKQQDADGDFSGMI